jgi:hypothetical protein
MLEIIGNVCTGFVFNKPIVAVAVSLVGWCDILERNVHVYHMRSIQSLVGFYCRVERYRFLSCVVLCQYTVLGGSED